MTDVLRQLRGYGEQLEAALVALEVDEIRTQRVGAGPVRPLLERSPRSTVSRWVVVAAAAALIIAGALVVMSAEKQGNNPTVDQPSDTTLPSRSTTSLPTLGESSRPLTPSGPDVVAIPNPDLFESTISDGAGSIWSYGWAGLIRFDPTTGETSRWTVADDAWFSPGVFADIAPSREGGVWLFGSVIARFDGTGFARVIDVPGTVIGLAEGDNGTLWAAIGGAGVLRWDGAAWVRTAVNRVNTNSSIATDTSGGVWVTSAALDSEAGGSGNVPLLHFNGTNWRVHGAYEPDLTPGAVGPMAISPDGTVWLSVGPQANGEGSRLLHLDGGEWSTHVAPDLGPSLDSAASLAVGSDGTVWASFVDPDEGHLTVVSLDGQTWTTYDSDAGLDPNGWLIATVAAGDDEVFLGRGSELLQLVDDGWERVLPDPESLAVDSLDELVAVSYEELWGISWDTVWHYRDGSWKGYSAVDGLPGASIRDLAVGPDDTVWVAADGGVAYLDGDRWIVVDEQPAFVVTSDRVGPVWVAGGDRAGEGELRIIAIERVDGAWTATPIETHPLDWVDSMAVGLDGSLWIGSHGGGWSVPGRGMARYYDGVWHLFDHLGASTIEMVGDIAVAPNGDLWTIVTTTDGRGPLVVQYDGTAWTIHEAAVLGSGHAAFDAGHRLWIAPDGRVIVARPLGEHWDLRIFDGREWTATPTDLAAGTRVGSMAPDGTLWGWNWGNLVRFSAG